MLLAAGEPSSSLAKTGAQQPGELLEEAEKRELRSKKDAISAEAESSWQAWRALHPRADASLESPGADLETFRVEDLEDPFFTFSLPSQPEGHKGQGAAGSQSKKRWQVGGFFFAPQATTKGGVSRLQSMRSWMKRASRAPPATQKRGSDI